MKRKTMNAAGYVMIFVGKGKPRTTKYGFAYEHRVVMQQHLGRDLKSSEWVHHINFDKADNRIENLEILSPHQHMITHNSGKLKSRTMKAASRVLELRKQGKLVREICADVDLSHPTVRKILNKHPIICDKCGRKFSELKGLGMHIRRTHRGYQSEH